MKMPAFFHRHRLLLVIALPITLTALAYILSLFDLGIPCVFRQITGLLCPGCGNTGAALCLLKLRFRDAFHYNNLFLLEYTYLGLVYIRSSISYVKGGRFSYRPIHIALDYTVLVVVVLWGIIRNFI